MTTQVETILLRALAAEERYRDAQDDQAARYQHGLDVRRACLEVLELPGPFSKVLRDRIARG